MLPRPYVGSYSSKNGYQFLHKPWNIALPKSIETFIMISMGDMPTIKYSQNLGSIMDKEKQKISKEYRIGDTCFTSFATIGVNLYTRHPNNLNNVNRDSNDLVSVIIFLGTYVNCGKKGFNDGDNMNDNGKIAHVLQHSHGRCVIGAFDKIYMKALFGTYIDLFYCLSSTIQYLFTQYIMVQDFMANIYHQEKRNISMMTGVVFFQNKMLERYTIQNINILIQTDIISKNDHVEDTRIRWTYSGRKRRSTDYVYLNGSPYSDAE